MRILFVCLGNICRSPTAEGVMRALIEDESAEHEVESAGTGDWHVGEPPDERARATGRRRGIELDGAARQVVADDFERFDLIVAMDRSNHADLIRLAPHPNAASRVRLLREFDPEADSAGDLDVPDPYFGGGDGFDEVFDLVERACRGLLSELARTEPR